MIVVVASRSIGIGAREILSISLPRTNTFVGSDSEVLLPSKTLALLKRVTAASTCWPCAILAEKVSAQARIAGAKYPTYGIQPSLSHVFMGERPKQYTASLIAVGSCRNLTSMHGHIWMCLSRRRDRSPMQRPVKQLGRIELYHQVLAKNSRRNDRFWHIASFAAVTLSGAKSDSGKQTTIAFVSSWPENA